MTSIYTKKNVIWLNADKMLHLTNLERKIVGLRLKIKYALFHWVLSSSQKFFKLILYFHCIQSVAEKLEVGKNRVALQI